MEQDRLKGAAAAAPHRAGRLDGRILLLALGTFAIGTDVFVIAGILPRIARDLSVSVEAAGQIVTAYALTYALGSPLLAALTARWRRERTIILALAGFAAADAICALAPSYAVLMAARVFAGSCAALYSPTAYTMAAALSPPERRGAGLATVALGITSATVFGVPLGTWIGQHFGWHATFALGCLLSASAAAALKRARMPPVEVTAAPISAAARFAPLAQPVVLLSLIANLFWSTGTYTIYTYTAVLLGERLGLANVALLLLGYGLGGLAGSQLGGRLVDRFGATALIIAGVTVNIFNLGLLNLTGGTELGGAAALFVMAFCGWAIFPAQQSRLLHLAPEHGGIVLSLISSTIYIGSAGGAALGGVLLAHFARTVPPYVASAVTVVGLGLFLLSMLIHRKRESAGPGRGADDLA